MAVHAVCPATRFVLQVPASGFVVSGLLQRAYSSGATAPSAGTPSAAGAQATAGAGPAAGAQTAAGSQEPYDVCLVGAGMVGAALVALLRKCPLVTNVLVP